ncbi:hypothetical protein WMF18_11375 [Sorangium sp. So ce315]|uniref:hypothetical protein n=1 Tax=Sorangium sp. So ce315 TaxID=3133299 RepID=UPI003F62F199
MAGRSRRRRLIRAARAGALLFAVLSCACRPEQGAPYECNCIFVTDFDDDAKLDVEICAPSEARAEGLGRGCAQTHAPGPVSECSCRRIQDRGACELRACRATPREP